ncbi:hypothetical protein [Micromonospora globbae]|uniref:hypothetical protein n=1 Tax=Micromonospora globbae TaxID=1894969 RepID=UPI001F030FFC|nr:hypothetical protein [Micromonospora globbae]
MQVANAATPKPKPLTTCSATAASTALGEALRPYLTHIYQRWNAGCTDAALIYAEIREQGYRGSERTVRRHLQPLRESGRPAPPPPTDVTVRQATNWITRDPDTLTESTGPSDTRSSTVAQRYAKPLTSSAPSP